MEPWSGGSFGSRGECLLAPNPGMMTLDGTNTWLLREPGSSVSVVVDPGPIEDGHLDLVDEITGDVGLILLTHHHFDHSEVAASLAERKGCVVRALDPAYCVGADPLADDEVLDVGGLALRVITTPGHTADSISLLLPAEKALLSGDMVLGRGTTVVAYPDGQLGPYFDSIAKMRALVTNGEVEAIWPAHGPVLADGGAVLDHYAAHRRQRLVQVEEALAALGVGVPDPDDEALPRRVVEIVYADVDEALWVPAEWSVRAQLAYLAARG
ncbi:MBL fold metallo-hydrolase [soil metagenome]